MTALEPPLAGEQRAAAANVVYRAISVAVEKGCRLALIVIAAPILGRAAFGAYQYALTLTALFAMVADVGVSTWTIRGLARDRSRSREIAAIGFRVRGMGVLPFLLAAAIAARLSGPGEARVLIVLLGVAAAANMYADYAGAIFRGLERLRDEAVLNTGRALLVTAASLAGLGASGGSATGLAAGMAAGSLVSAAYGRWLVAHRTDALVGDRSQLGGTVAIRQALVESAPIWVATLLGLLYFKIDVLILRALAGDAELGAYSAAYKVFEAATILPTIVMAAGLPPLARAYRDPARRRHWERRLAGVLLAMGGLVAAVVYAARRPIVGLLFGADFVAAVPSLRILAAAIPLAFVNGGLLPFLIARGLERRNVVLSGVLLIINVGVNLIAIPRLGGQGAAWATVVTEAAVTLGCLLALRLPATRPAA
jgi:O-antigen/teichoic acid export membrane protein